MEIPFRSDAGIAVSGMPNPAKLLNFFDVASTWNPSLAFVMGGALAVTFIGYRIVLRRQMPVFDDSLHPPPIRRIDLALVGGSALFGVGWGSRASVRAARSRRSGRRNPMR